MGVGVGMGVARRGAAGRDVQVRCGAVRRAEMREHFTVESIKTETIKRWH